MIVVRQRRVGRGPRELRDRSGSTHPVRDTDARIEAIESALRRHPEIEFRHASTSDAELDHALGEAHDPLYLELLAASCERLDRDAQDFDHEFTCPGVELDTPLARNGFDLAREGTRTALTALSALTTPESVSYALCRPPGHHAGPSWLGGYCYLNHAAACVARCRQRGWRRVAVLDIDYHFGNGTAAILEPDSDAMFLSVHCDPRIAYPYVGTPTTTRTQSIAFTSPPSAAAYLDAIARSVDSIHRFAPHALVASLGFDVIDGDPHGGWTLQPEVFDRVGALLAELVVPQCWVQEGGYSIQRLGACASNLVAGFIGTRQNSKLRSHHA